MLTNAADSPYTISVHQEPRTLEHLQELVARHAHVRAIGSRHSFNSIGDCPEALISLRHFNRIVELDGGSPNPTVTIEGGVICAKLGSYLHRKGFAIHNLASLPHIAFAGASATGSHGSGDSLQCLSAAVVGVRLVKSDGNLVDLTPETMGEKFNGAVVALGGLGIVVELKLAIVPTYDIAQEVYRYLPWTVLRRRFDEFTSAAYSVSFFTNWRRRQIQQVWFKRRCDGSTPLTVARDLKPAVEPLHPVEGHPADACTEQMNRPGPWHLRLPHFDADHVPSIGHELQAEYLVPREHAIEAMEVFFELEPLLRSVLYVSEIRTVKGDAMWLSPFYGRDSVAIHCTFKPQPKEVLRILPRLEAKLEPFEARPHWGKLFTMSGERLEHLYPRMSDFRELLLQYDPEGKCRNAFLDNYIFRRRTM